MKPAAVITTLILVVGVLISPGAAVAQTARGTTIPTRCDTRMGTAYSASMRQTQRPENTWLTAIL